MLPKHTFNVAHLSMKNHDLNGYSQCTPAKPFMGKSLHNQLKLMSMDELMSYVRKPFNSLDTTILIRFELCLLSSYSKKYYYLTICLKYNQDMITATIVILQSWNILQVQTTSLAAIYSMQLIHTMIIPTIITVI